MTIVVTGGSGYIGTELTKALLAKQYVVIVIDIEGPRIVHQNLFYIPWDLEAGALPFNVLERTDAVIHLDGGSPLSSKHFIDSLSQTTNKPSIVVSASSAGFYGSGGEEVLDEKSSKGEGIYSENFAEAEKEIMRAETFGCRVVIVRSAVVFGREGFLKPLWNLSRFHLAGAFSKKDFWMPWIHINDLIRGYLFALETGTVQGIVNAVEPIPTKHSDITRAFKKVTRSISLGAITRFFVGKTKKESLFDQRISPQRLTDKGFSFAFTNPEEAIRDLKQNAKN